MKKKLVLKKTSELRSRQPTYKIRYADELNRAQYDAVMHTEGPALVIAGAGTGKTRTLVYRVARLIEDGIAPKSILLLTFTRKASSEMLRRAASLLDGRCRDVSGGTFHSFAHHILRRHATKLGFTNNFSVLDQSDAEDVVNLLRVRVTEKRSKRRFPRKNTLFGMFSASVNRRTPLSAVVRNDYPHYEEEIDTIEVLHELYAKYKRNYNLMDYDDLLVHFQTLCEESAAVYKSLQRDYRYVMVDEYQDTNLLQHAIVRTLAGKRRNVMAVGDDAQSVYSFRGAHYRNILDFPGDYPQCEVIKLEENYRSSQQILGLTNEIISRAAFGYEKELYSRIVRGGQPAIVRAANEEYQSQFVAQQVLEHREEGIPLSEIAVLFRSGFHSADLEIELNRSNIPYEKFGGFKFVETAHIKDIIAHLRVTLNPRDAVSWHRILLLLEGVGPKTAAEVVDKIVEGKLTPGKGAPIQSAQRGAQALEYLFDVIRNTSKEKISVEEKAAKVVEYYRPIMQRKYDDYRKRQKDIDAFLTISERYRSLQSLLADMAIEPPIEAVEDVEEPGKEEEFLTLSTIHSAKGLEWSVVFIIWALDGRFPPVKSFDSIDALEEERRLMYVACTRAKEHLYVSYPINIFDRESGSILSKPSRFIEGMAEGIADELTIVVEEDGDGDA